MFTNIQYEEEWECTGEFRKRVYNVYRDKTGSKVATFVMDGGKSAKKDIKLPKGAKRIKYEMKPCALYNKTKFCRKCAYKLHFKCPVCGKVIRKTREKATGKSTKYGHGGY